MDEKIAKNQKNNFVQALLTDLATEMEEGSMDFASAFNRVSLKYLEFDPDEDGVMSDGKGDMGIDFWCMMNGNEATVFQFKSQDYTQGLNVDLEAGPDYLKDLRRISDLLKNLDADLKTANKHVREFVSNLKDILIECKTVDLLSDAEAIKSEKKDADFSIDINFVCLADKLTKQAEEEFANLQNTNFIEYEKIKIKINYYKYFIDDLLESRWRQTNIKWTNKKGQKQDDIKITVADDYKSILYDTKWCVFFGKCCDLVRAYKDMGYQIFEPNVRCELRTSKINQAIRDTLKTEKGRKEFKHLNNGITIICDNFTKPSENKKQITILHPGIINGLQTVKSLNDAYKKMSTPEKVDFENNCEVLIRLHMKKSVKDFNELIKATNNQNPMNPRNLRSNNPEQLQYQLLFAKLGWFYSRKEGEWNAFSNDEKAWGSRLDQKKKKDFKVGDYPFKKVDNLEVAQAYFSFIGFTTDAMNKKKRLFDDDDMYRLLFEYKIAKHGKDYGLLYSKKKVSIETEAIKENPAPEMLLLSYLLYAIAKELAPKLTELKKETVERLGIGDRKPEEINVQLKDDPKYIKGYVIRGTLYVFVEFVGYILYRAYAGNINSYAIQKIFNIGSMADVYKKYDFLTLKDTIKNDSYSKNDLIIILWKLYEHIIEELVANSSWLSEWKAETNVPRFHYSEKMRSRILGRVDEINDTLKKRNLFTPWSEGLDEYKGVYNYVLQVLKK